MFDLNLSWHTLREQKVWLQQQLPHSREADGLVSLIEAIQKQGEKMYGRDLVYGEEGK
jgi:hypothetical protein